MQKTCCIALCSTKTDGVSADIIGGGVEIAVMTLTDLLFILFAMICWPGGK